MTVAEDWATISEICRAVGLEPKVDDRAVPEEILALARLRDEARADRDFDEADRLRAAISDAGYEIQDEPDGTRVLPAG